MIPLQFFYKVKPLIPRTLQVFIRRKMAKKIRANNVNTWPVGSGCGNPPENWSGWPKGKKFALVLTHDVETAKGHARCLDLMRIEQQLGFCSSFNFVPQRYQVSEKIRENLGNAGFEVGVHGLNHDGKLFLSYPIFRERAEKINYFLKLWKAVGFRAPSMHHNLDWIAELDIEYDMSTFDIDPFEPQSDGVETIFPFLIYNAKQNKSFLEIPYTLPQDFTVFIILQEKNIDIWKNKLCWIAKNGGMVLLNTHPDYMNFGDSKSSIQEYPVEFYSNFLRFIKHQFNGQYWHALPKDMANFLGNSNMSSAPIITKMVLQ